MRPVFHFTVTPECLCRGSSIHHGSPIKDFGDDERENHRMTVTSYMNHYSLHSQVSWATKLAPLTQKRITLWKLCKSFTVYYFWLWHSKSSNHHLITKNNCTIQHEILSCHSVRLGELRSKRVSPGGSRGIFHRDCLKRCLNYVRSGECRRQRVSPGGHDTLLRV